MKNLFLSAVLTLAAVLTFAFAVMPASAGNTLTLPGLGSVDVIGGAGVLGGASLSGSFSKGGVAGETSKKFKGSASAANDGYGVGESSLSGEIGSNGKFSDGGASLNVGSGNLSTTSIQLNRVAPGTSANGSVSAGGLSGAGTFTGGGGLVGFID